MTLRDVSYPSSHLRHEQRMNAAGKNASPDAVSLCVMLKAPRSGLVKTRLARDLGAAAAVAAYRQLVEHQLANVPGGWQVLIFYTPADAEREMREWIEPQRPEALFFPQRGGGLGERLIDAVRRARSHGTGSVICIGGDCPGLDSGRLLRAAQMLQSSELVLVPATDGGYVLIGMKRLHQLLFQGIEWSTAQVLEQTLQRARQLQLGVQMLDPLEDVDDAASWSRCRHLLERR